MFGSGSVHKRLLGISDVICGVNSGVVWVLVVPLVVLTCSVLVVAAGSAGITGAIYGVFTFCPELIFCLIGHYTGAFDVRVALP